MDTWQRGRLGAIYAHAIVMANRQEIGTARPEAHFVDFVETFGGYDQITDSEVTYWHRVNDRHFMGRTQDVSRYTDARILEGLDLRAKRTREREEREKRLLANEKVFAEYRQRRQRRERGH